MNGDPSGICCFCDAPLGAAEPSSLLRRVVIPTEGNLAVQPEWRREVSSRVQNYRARRSGKVVSELQTALPFDSETPYTIELPDPHPEDAAPARSDPAQSPRKNRSERFEIAIPQLQAVPAAGQGHWTAVSSPDANSTTHSVASLAVRRKAALVDAGLLLFSYGGMLALFAVLGGHIGFNKLDLAVVGATFALFYAQYFALFTLFGGATPGMMLCGLRVISFAGGTPTSRQMAWRSFGYLISAGTCFLGFLWALWDDDQLCWQDRISQTYLTTNEEIAPD